MTTGSQINDESILKDLGERLTQLRLVKNLTQQELADEAGLGIRTLQRLESGGADTRLSGFVSICRALGLSERFNLLIPEPTVSPIAQLKRQGKKRKRASNVKPATVEPKKWTWGEAS